MILREGQVHCGGVHPHYLSSSSYYYYYYYYSWWWWFAIDQLVKTS
jgi:hypothetical protein